MKQHARFSPSKLEALASCPCFDYQQIKVKAGEESPADRGKRLHKLVETGDNQYAREEQDKELHEKVDILLAGLRASNGDSPLVELTEEEVTVADLTYGTADKILLWPELKKGKVIDWKFIRSESVSEPGNNIQLKCYVAGVFERYPDIDELEAFVAAPQINWLPDPHTFTRADLPAIRAEIEKITMDCADPFKKPRACDLCKQCANASRCPALGSTAVVVAQNIGLPVPSTFAPDSLAIPEDRAKAYIIAKALNNWAEQVTKSTNEWVRQGNTLPGHTTVTRQGSMKVTDVEAAVVALRKLLSDSEILHTMNISLTKVTEVVAEKEGKKTARDTVESLLIGLTERGPDVVYALRKKGDKL